jgi:hypothetical protein
MNERTKTKIADRIDKLEYGQIIITKKDGRIIGIDTVVKENLGEFLVDEKL